MKDNIITTYKKIKMDPRNPKNTDINIYDIAHALSLMTRGNGHISHFFSVAQHSINCAFEAAARKLDRDTQLACLLHDASEAYISDITRPVKYGFDVYLEIEKKLQDTIYSAFGLDIDDEMNENIKKIDDAMLYHEMLNLMEEKVFDDEPVIESKPDFSERAFNEVETEFLRVFESYVFWGK